MAYALIKIKCQSRRPNCQNCARVQALAVVASQDLTGFRIDQVYPRADETGYRLIGVVVAFRRIIGDPTLNAKPGIRTAVEKSAHNKRPSRGRCPRAPSVRPRRPLTLLHGHRPCGQRSGAHRNVVRTARPQGPSFGGARRPDRRYRGVREPTEIFALRL